MWIIGYLSLDYYPFTWRENVRNSIEKNESFDSRNLSGLTSLGNISDEVNMLLRRFTKNLREDASLLEIGF